MKKGVFIVLIAASLSWGNDRKLSPELKGKPSGAVVDVIVQFKVTPGPSTLIRWQSEVRRLQELDNLLKPIAERKKRESQS